MKSLSLFPDEKKPQLVHKDKTGKRKTARLLVRKRPIHLILKSRYILVTHRDWIEGRIQDYSRRFGIRLYRHALCGDHSHFAIEIPHADYYRRFIRALTGVIARKMGKGIWKLLPFTRVAKWGADFRNLVAYIQKNDEETRVLRKYEPRKRTGKNRTYDRPATLAPCVKNFL